MAKCESIIAISTFVGIEGNLEVSLHHLGFGKGPGTYLRIGKKLLNFCSCEWRINMSEASIHVVGNKFNLEEMKKELLAGPHTQAITITEPEPITPGATARPAMRQMELYEVAVHFGIAFAAAGAYEWVRDRIKNRVAQGNLQVKEEKPPVPKTITKDDEQ
jgi:hypothetical protein